MIEWGALTVAELVDRACRRHRDRVAVMTEAGEKRTYGELSDRSWRLVNALNGLGYEKGARVGILAANCPEYIEVEFACGRGGFVKVPLYVRNTPAEHCYFLADADVDVLIGEASLLDGIAARLEEEGVAKRPRLIAIDAPGDAEALEYEELLIRASSQSSRPHLLPTDPFQIRYTSGTTGRPKGAVSSHQAMVVASLGNVVHNSWEDPVLPGDVLMHVIPFSHVSTFNIIGHSLYGVTHLPFKKWDPDHFLNAVQEQHVANVLLMPTQVNMLMTQASALSTADASSLKTLVYGGEPMAAGVLDAALDRFGPVLTQGYGSTEAPSLIIGLPKSAHVGHVAKARGPACGWAMPWVETAILDLEGQPVARGETGELVVRGPFLLDGYLNNPAATANVLRDGWYHTGDIGRMDEDDCVILADRSGDMIISGGYNIYPAEVEAAILTHPDVLECVVFGAPDPTWGESVRAVVRLSDGAVLTTRALSEHSAGELARFKFPKNIFVTSDAFPKTDAGKTLRRALRDATADLEELA
ncbi:class I adenylate-forming enzyme family protein [Nocardioides sp. Root190]|uniref:class I adenylate-forming enzyme family protein n=1 Tax=Nocardioides sp. Root190 TaxID=1736488 RepID=UPI000A516DE7|nr:AMP-binding protein [Nocardioides sp. Root190]